MTAIKRYYNSTMTGEQQRLKHHTFFEELYDRYKTPMFYIAKKILKDTYAAEDAVSESLIKIAKHLQKISQLHEKEQRDYIFILTKNTALDMYRKQRKVVDIEQAEIIPDFRLVDETVFGNMQYEMILQTIEQMDDKWKDPLKLYCFYEHTVEEIAEIMGIKPHTVYYRIACAKKLLLESLKEAGE